MSNKNCSCTWGLLQNLHCINFLKIILVSYWMINTASVVLTVPGTYCNQAHLVNIGFCGTRTFNNKYLNYVRSSVWFLAIIWFSCMKLPSGIKIHKYSYWCFHQNKLCLNSECRYTVKPIQDVIHQTRETVFLHISQHWEES